MEDDLQDLYDRIEQAKATRRAIRSKIAPLQAEENQQTRLIEVLLERAELLWRKEID